MESQVHLESHSISKEDLDQNMNNTVVNTGDSNMNQWNAEHLLTKREANAEIMEEHSHNGIDQNVVTSDNRSEKYETIDHELHPIDNVNVSANSNITNVLDMDNTNDESLVEEIYNEDFSSEEIEENSTDANFLESSENKPIGSLPKMSMILSAELTSDSSHFSTNADSHSSSASPTSSIGRVRISPEVSTTFRSSTGSKSKGKQRRRGSAWTDDETDFLMEVWARQTELMKQKGCDESVTCAPVYRLISRCMTDQGYDKSWEQCKTRIHTLKRAYKITKDEIDNGEQTITYCRHFDKLEIISGDNANITPGMLAAGLEQERTKRDVKEKGKKQPVKRKLVVGDNPNLVKRSNNGTPALPNTGIIPKLLAQAPTLSVSKSTDQPQNISGSGMTWYPPPAMQVQQQQMQQPQPPQQQQQQSLLQQTLASALNTPVPQSIKPIPPIPAQVSNNLSYQQPPACITSPPPPYSATVTNNQAKLVVKSESSHIVTLDQYSTVSSSTSWHTTQSNAMQCSTAKPAASSGGSDLERMRLGVEIEMRKLEVERCKLEMEERQRREDRDHQYRMMQLLMFGLGQQNCSQAPGQLSEMTPNHYSTDLLRALENGLVPCGSQKDNEKGLSFSEL